MPGKTRAENDKRRVTACFAISIRSSWARCAWNIFPEIDYRFSDAEDKNAEACCHECNSTFRLNEIKYHICNSTTRFDVNVKYEVYFKKTRILFSFLEDLLTTHSALLSSKYISSWLIHHYHFSLLEIVLYASFNIA